VHRRSRPLSPWLCSLPTLLTFSVAVVILFTIVRSFLVRQLDVKGCRMPGMHPAYAELVDFDTEHTRFATKYSLYLYREVGIDDDDLKVVRMQTFELLLWLTPSAGERCACHIHPRECR
jgi:hypothetical protein